VTNTIARLTVLHDAQPPVEHLLTDDQLNGGFSIGSDSTNALRLLADTVSRQHAELRRRIGQVQLTRLSETNPVVVGGRKLALNERVTLTARTEIVIAPFRLLFEPVDLAKAAMPPVAAPAIAPQPAPVPVQTLRSIAPSDPPAAPVLGEERTVVWPIAEDQPGRYLFDLPTILRHPTLLRESGEEHQADDLDQGQFLGSYLKIFEAIWEPLEQRQAHLEQYFDPRTCPQELLDMLASWLGVEAFAGLTIKQQRRLIAAAGEATSLRGTRKGLRMVIKACTGVETVISDLPGQPYVFHVALPPEGAPMRALVEQIIRTHKPAYMGYTLE